MWTKALCVLFALMLMAAPTLAQTATPTPPICEGGIDIGNLNLGGSCRSNTIDADTKSDLYRAMATAAYQANQLPEQIEASGQNGQSIIPDTAAAIQIFGYIKWLFSPNTTQEIMGKTLAPFALNVFIVFMLVTVMTALYFLVNFIVLIVKGVIWVINQFLKLIPFW